MFAGFTLWLRRNRVTSLGHLVIDCKLDDYAGISSRVFEFQCGSEI